MLGETLLENSMIFHSNFFLKPKDTFEQNKFPSILSPFKQKLHLSRFKNMNELSKSIYSEASISVIASRKAISFSITSQLFSKRIFLNPLKY